MKHILKGAELVQTEITIPTTLLEAVKLFDDAEYSVNFRWPEGVKCPYSQRYERRDVESQYQGTDARTAQADASLAGIHK